MTMLSTVAWSDHKPFLLSGIRKLYDSGHMSDLTVKCGGRDFLVHKLVLGFFTDFFKKCDGVWTRIDISAEHFDNALKFMYHGQVSVSYNAMEGFLQAMKSLNIKLFKPDTMNVEGIDNEEEAPTFHQERYELNDFQLLCRKCYKCYPNEHALKKHLWACTRDKIFKCKFCDKAYRFRNEIITHEMTHTGDFKYTCPQEGCDRKFLYRNHLVSHMQGAHGDPDKRKRTRQRNPVTKSEYKFDGENYICTYPGCEKVVPYLRLDTLKRHIAVVHQKKRLKCQQCDCSYTSHAMLKHHIANKHDGEKPFECTECPEAFALQSMLTTHFKNRHTAEGRERMRLKARLRTERLRAEREAERKKKKVKREDDE